MAIEIVDVPIKNSDFLYRYVKLPEGSSGFQSPSKASSRIPPICAPATFLREAAAIGGRGVEEVASTALDKAQNPEKIHWEEKMHGENLGTELTLVYFG